MRLLIGVLEGKISALEVCLGEELSRATGLGTSGSDDLYPTSPDSSQGRKRSGSVRRNA